MSEKNSFSKYANHYDSYNIIQQIVAKALIRELSFKPKKILELGCGSGQIYRNITWDIEKYTAIDSSLQMCELHHKDKKVEVICANFDDSDFFNIIKDKKYDMVISSSALQWSKDLTKLIGYLSKVTNNINAVLFTSNTFKTIQKITEQDSPILDEKSIKNAFSKYFDCTFEKIEYKLQFDSKKELFSYIKKSGVSGKSALDFKVAKKLHKEYNLNYLEFEVIFVKTNSKKS